MDFRKPYTQARLYSVPEGDSLTKQSEKDSCDVNKILYNYKRTGTLARQDTRVPQYGDIGITDFQSAMHLVMEAQDSFDQLPSAVRKRFGHSVPAFMDFVSDATNRDEAAKLGILMPVPEPIKAPEVVAPTV